MKAKFFILVGLLLMVMASSATAQDAELPCAVGDVLNLEYKGQIQGDWLQSVIVTLNANIDDDDTINFLGTARELRRILARMDSNCRGLHFTSDEDGMRPVIGPVDFVGGIWRVTFTTTGYGSVKLEELSGDCGRDALLFAAFEGDATDGAQKVITTGAGCEALISVENTGDPWDLMFELVKAAD